MTKPISVHIYLRGFGEYAAAVRALIQLVDAELLQFYLQGPGTLEVHDESETPPSIGQSISLGFSLCTRPPGTDEVKFFKALPTVVVFNDGDIATARLSLEAGAVDSLCFSELGDAKAVLPCLLYAARRVVLERQLEQLARNAREVCQIEQEAFARFALLPANDAQELFGLLTGMLDDKLSPQGQRTLHLVSGALLRLLPPEKKERQAIPFKRDVAALATLLVAVLRGRGIDADIELQMQEDTLPESRRAECQEFLLHAAILLLLSGRPGMRIRVTLAAQLSGARLELLAPSELLADQGLDRRPFLNELFGSLLRVSGDDSGQVRCIISTEAALTQGGLRVLIVDDNHVNALLLERLVARQGHKPVKFLSSVEALEACRNSNFDVVFTDIHMPELDGITFVCRLRQDLELDTPVYAVTADGASSTKRRCLDAGMEDVIIKPYSSVTIRAILTAVAERRLQRRLLGENGDRR